MYKFTALLETTYTSMHVLFALCFLILAKNCCLSADLNENKQLNRDNAMYFMLSRN